jgi:hypothetical protein
MSTFDSAAASLAPASTALPVRVDRALGDDGDLLAGRGAGLDPVPPVSVVERSSPDFPHPVANTHIDRNAAVRT